MKYEWKAVQEVAWTVVVAAGIQVATVLVEFDPEAVLSDPKSWVIALVGSVIRAAAGAAIARKAVG